MMRAATCALLLLLCGCGARTAEPVCVLDPAAMPESWRPSGARQKTLSTAPWSAEESKDALHAIDRGMAELTGFFAYRPAAIAALRDDAVEAFIDLSYAAANTPALRSAAREQALRMLTLLMAPYLAQAPEQIACSEARQVLSYTNYARDLLPPGDARMPAMVARTNAAWRACGSLAAAMGYDYRARIASPKTTTNEAWDLTMWTITLIDARLVPGLELSAEAREMPAAAWHYLAQYPLVGARGYPEREQSQAFYDTAYLATHIAYIPTGYGRHPISVADAPAVHAFLRENFYAVLEMGELDLVAEFADLFRQYGCGEANDLQLRDGARYILKLFHAAGDSFMARREPWERDVVPAYTAIHKPWTGMAGLRVRVPEPPAPGTYGGIFRQEVGQAR